MTIITSMVCFIWKQDRDKNLLSEDHRADGKVPRRDRRVSREGMVNKLERVGGIDGVHDQGCRISPASPGLDRDASVAEDYRPPRDRLH